MATESHAATSSLVIDDTGTGRPVLVLHGGGGPDTVQPIAAQLAATHRVLTATLPGWNGAPRPDTMTTVGDYAQAYLDHLAELGCRDVVVIGSSLGGWIAAEMAARDRGGVLGGVVLVDAAGIIVEGARSATASSTSATSRRPGSSRSLADAPSTRCLGDAST